MASRNLNPAGSHFTQEVVSLDGSFAPNGTGAVDAASNRGRGFTVARTGVGAFLVTVADAFPVLLSAQATVQLNAAADTVAQIGAVSGRTVAIRTLTAGAAADIAANANNRVNFSLKFANTSNPQRG